MRGSEFQRSRIEAHDASNLGRPLNLRGPGGSWSSPTKASPTDKSGPARRSLPSPRRTARHRWNPLTNRCLPQETRGRHDRLLRRRCDVLDDPKVCLSFLKRHRRFGGTLRPSLARVKFHDVRLIHQLLLLATNDSTKVPPKLDDLFSYYRGFEQFGLQHGGNEGQECRQGVEAPQPVRIETLARVAADQILRVYLFQKNLASQMTERLEHFGWPRRRSSGLSPSAYSPKVRLPSDE